MNVGLFGGTFNPIHNGHMGVIAHVKKTFGLDMVYMIPSAIPPHKPTGNLAPARDRFQMVSRAVLTVPGLTASDSELKREGKSFSIDTIRQFKRTIEATDHLFFIMGTDAFFDIATWKGARDIFEMTDLIVMTRAGDRRRFKEIELFLQKTISSGYTCSADRQYTCATDRKYACATDRKYACATDRNIPYSNSNRIAGDIRFSSTDTYTFANTNPDVKPVHICKVPDIPISSTEIRQRIRNHQSIKGLVPPSVERIIIKKGLYCDQRT